MQVSKILEGIMVKVKEALQPKVFFWFPDPIDTIIANAPKKRRIATRRKKSTS